MRPNTSNQALAEIVTDARLGDAAAVEELVRRSRAMATRYAFGILGDGSLAEDAAQEALTQAIASLGDLRAPEAFITWLRRIVHRQCDRIIRRQHLTIVPLNDLIEPVDGDPRPEELILRAELVLAVRAAVHGLPERQRGAATAFYLEDLSQASAADALGISVSTLNNRLHAARRALKRNLISMSTNEPARPATGLHLAAPSLEAHARDILAAIEETSPAGVDWRNGRLSKSRFDWTASRIGLEKSEIRALVGVYDLSMRIGHEAVRTAGFNLDYTASNTPKDALGQVTHQAAQAAAAAGYGLAVAVGHTDALRCAGFVPAWGQTMTFMPSHSFPDPAPTVDTEAFEPIHRDDIAALNETENEGLTGTGVGPTYLVNKEPGGFLGRLWRDAAGEVVGYVSYAVVKSWRNPALVGPSHRGYDRLLWHDQSAGDPHARLAVLAQLAREHNCGEVVFDRLHSRSPLARRLRQSPHRVEEGHRRYSIKVLSLDTVLRSVLDELGRRLGAANVSSDLSLRLIIDSQTVTIRGRPGDLNLGPDRGDVTGTIEGDQRLANLLVGTRPPAEVLLDAAAAISGDAHWLAAILFPHQAPQMDNQTL